MRRLRSRLLFVALLGFGVIAALFGPIKYGILPDHLRREQLPAGNALVEGATFVAILLGTIVGGLAARGGGESRGFCGAGDRLCGRLLAVGAADSADRRRRAASENRGQYRRLDRRDDPPFARRRAAVVGRDGDELVLAGRHRGAVAAAAADQDADRRQRGHRHGLSGAVLDRGRRRLRPWRRRSRAAASCSERRSSARCCSACSRSISALRHLASAPQRRRKRRARCFHRRSEFARRDRSVGLAVAGGLFIVPAFAAVQAWTGADYRARTSPRSTCSTPRS